MLCSFSLEVSTWLSTVAVCAFNILRNSQLQKRRSSIHSRSFYELDIKEHEVSLFTFHWVEYCLYLNHCGSELEDSSFEGNAQLPSEGMRALLTRPEGHKTRMPHHQPTCAMFYSVNSPQDSLCKLIVCLLLICYVIDIIF